VDVAAAPGGGATAPASNPATPASNPAAVAAAAAAAAGGLFSPGTIQLTSQDREAIDRVSDHFYVKRFNFLAALSFLWL